MPNIGVISAGIVLMFAVQLETAAKAAATKVTGAAILQHPCGQVSVRHMVLVHGGKTEEAFRLGTPDMQAQWKALPAKEREMMAAMMRSMSQTRKDYEADINRFGVLTIDGSAATLKITKTRRDASGSSTETLTQSFQIDGSRCAITR